MKNAQLESKEKPLREIVLIMTFEEISLLCVAIEEYTQKHPRSKKAKTLFNEMEAAAVY